MTLETGSPLLILNSFFENSTIDVCFREFLQKIANRSNASSNFLSTEPRAPKCPTLTNIMIMLAFSSFPYPM